MTAGLTYVYYKCMQIFAIQASRVSVSFQVRSASWDTK